MLQEEPTDEGESKLSSAKVALRGAADGGGAVLRGITRGAKGGEFDFAEANLSECSR